MTQTGPTPPQLQPGGPQTPNTTGQSPNVSSAPTIDDNAAVLGALTQTQIDQDSVTVGNVTVTDTEVTAPSGQTFTGTSESFALGNGAAQQFNYDSDGNLTSVILAGSDSANRYFTPARNPDGTLRPGEFTYTDESGREQFLTIRFDDQGRPEWVIDEATYTSTQYGDLDGVYNVTESLTADEGRAIDDARLVFDIALGVTGLPELGYTAGRVVGGQLFTRGLAERGGAALGTDMMAGELSISGRGGAASASGGTSNATRSGATGATQRSTDPLAAVPEGASVRTLRPDPNGGAQVGVEFKWLNENGQTVRLRAHGPDGTAPPGSNAASGPTYRIQIGGRYLDAEGALYPRGVHNPNSPNYDPAAANSTHIPWPSDIPLPWKE
ncbi:hypothetical protein HLB23_24440 [Nocardia uniformis]|uniref:Bacterial toxin 30 domain-containing protein n=2 Tax=Nocardia uniformis TaxID=53432 RepID=A0A849C9C3_9NOCA|nr:hypothetical protein [Nocardia uniformis]